MLIKAFRFLWAFPNTAVGVPFVLLALCTRGRLRMVDGVLEVSGRAVAWVLEHGTLLKGGAAALTLGHIVLGRDGETLALTRRHERVHVAQCERWGPLFIPAYLLASLWLWLRGRDAYIDNPFEKEARAGE